MMRHSFFWLAIFVIIATSFAQKKPGTCPSGANDIGICALTCFEDFECRGTSKCCRTACGGSACVPPVTQTVSSSVKPGRCPAPSGPWVCSSRCSNDSDCRGKQKCCKNRCGALACMKAEGV